MIFLRKNYQLLCYFLFKFIYINIVVFSEKDFFHFQCLTILFRIIIYRISKNLKYNKNNLLTLNVS